MVPTTFWSKKNVGPKNWVKTIGSITTEIFLIWTNVVRTKLSGYWFVVRFG